MLRNSKICVKSTFSAVYYSLFTPNLCKFQDLRVRTNILTKVTIPFSSSIELQYSIHTESVDKLLPYLGSKTVADYHFDIVSAVVTAFRYCEQVTTDLTNVLCHLEVKKVCRR